MIKLWYRWECTCKVFTSIQLDACHKWGISWMTPSVDYQRRPKDAWNRQLTTGEGVETLSAFRWREVICTRGSSSSDWRLHRLKFRRAFEKRPKICFSLQAADRLHLFPTINSFLIIDCMRRLAKSQFTVSNCDFVKPYVWFVCAENWNTMEYWKKTCVVFTVPMVEKVAFAIWRSFNKANFSFQGLHYTSNKILL